MTARLVDDTVFYVYIVVSISAASFVLNEVSF